jgi:RNA polymerase sigma factor (sigma-70 family)
MASGNAVKKPRREYRPTLEGLEALRLFHAALPDLPDLAADHAPLRFTAPLPLEAPTAEATAHAWDTVLEGRLADLLETEPQAGRLVVIDPESFRAGIAQLDRYLGRSWARAGLPPTKHDDSTQAVYVSLIENLGRPGFDRLLSDIGQNGIKDVLSRETAEGPTFFRAIDAVKKRAQREHQYTSLDDAEFDPPAAAGPSELARSLGEAIEQTLNPREAELIRSTLAGETPAEIAERWGVAAKTVSNEKTRVLSKLREFLAAEAPGHG